MLKKLFTPYKIGTVTIPNRLVVTAMVTNYCEEDGMANERFIRYHEEKAKGGWGLIITEDYAVNKNAKGYKYIAGLYDDSQIESHKKLTDRIHKYDSKIFCQIYSPGRQTNPMINGGVQPVAPSAIACPAMKVIPKELTEDDIKGLVKDFGDSALRAKKAGFDGVEIHAAHGYLIAEFISPYSNKRVDKYGGCFDNRTRLLKEIINDIKSKVGEDFPIMVRISVEENIEGGNTIAQGLQLAQLIEELGADAINVSCELYGNYNNGIASTMYIEHAWQMDLAEQVKKLVKIPVITVNRINDPKMADIILQQGKADFIGRGRGSLADPFLPVKAKEGMFESIRYCLGCRQGCSREIGKGRTVKCLVNPEVGKEYIADYSPAEKPKKIMVVGSGLAGMEAAMIASRRGHHVTIYDKRDDVGGQFKSAAYPLYKGEFATFTSWLRRELTNLDVKTELNKTVDEDLIINEKPDCIILATGGKPKIPNIPGIKGDNVVFAEEALLGEKNVGNTIVICGAGEVGGETAGFFAAEERNVLLVDVLPDILSEMDKAQAIRLKMVLDKYGVKCITNTRVVEINNYGVLVESNGEKRELKADTVILAMGYSPENSLLETAKKHVKEVYVIGGAVETSNALNAVKDGYKIGMKV